VVVGRDIDIDVLVSVDVVETLLANPEVVSISQDFDAPRRVLGHLSCREMERRLLTTTTGGKKSKEEGKWREHSPVDTRPTWEITVVRPSYISFIVLARS
jgi:hypothetical protein